MGEGETAQVSFNCTIELEQSPVDAAFARGVVRYLSGDEQMAYNTWSQYRGSDRLLLIVEEVIAWSLYRYGR